MLIMSQCPHCGEGSIVPLSTPITCSNKKCRRSFQVNAPAGLKNQVSVFNYLRTTLKGQAPSKQIEKDLRLTREELKRVRKSFEEIGVIEEARKDYQFTRRYLYGHNSSKAPSQDEMRSYINESPAASDDVNEQAKKLAELHPKAIVEKIVVVGSLRDKDGKEVDGKERESLLQELRVEEIPLIDPNAREIILKQLLEKYPLVTNPVQRPMPVVIDLTWTENEGDMTKPRVLHKRQLSHLVPDKTPMLQSHN